MKKMWSFVLVAGLLAVIGCGDTTDNKGQTQTLDKKDKKEVALSHGESGHDWWCDEHGVKEEDCSMCSAKVAKAFRDKGDWCKEHKRAKSQCFICDPSLKDKFAAEYKAKYGKEPPEPEGQKPDAK